MFRANAADLKRELESLFNREEVLVGAVSRFEFNGHSLLPTVNNVKIV